MSPKPASVLAMVAGGCVLILLQGPSTPGEPLWPRPGGAPVELPGLHNVIHVSDQLYSGGSPEGDAGFESMKKLGIKTILSVDGARPDVGRAKKFQMRSCTCRSAMMASRRSRR